MGGDGGGAETPVEVGAGLSLSPLPESQRQVGP